VRGERYDATPEGEYFREAPELVVEIRSPSNTGTQLRQKSWLYLEHGAEQVWIIQPESSNVVVLTPQGDDRIVDESGTLEFRDLTIRVADLLRRRPRKE
jgi:Uma2 family endonuclease